MRENNQMKAPLLLMMFVLALFTASEQGGAQIRSPQFGIFAGGTLPRGDFKAETEPGWNAGGLLKIRVTRSLDLRLDGMFTQLGTRTIDLGTAAVDSKSDVALASFLAELNLGPDSAQYPGDNTVSPYINGGPALYRYKFEGTCTGACEGFLSGNEESGVGLNVGAGANVPLWGIPAFAEVRYHRFGTMFPITQADATATMITVSVGVKLR